uniref:Angel homolog 1 (Drosophila) n=1 Tax=Tetraodon nigroviridis TaxID=99883 RepID=H3DJ68_TETNG
DFTVMSYNILADDLVQANLDLYAHCPWQALDWNYRCRRILLEIQKWAPDILCLQEVQENHFYQHVYPVLSQLGYSCAYKRRTGNKTDGCATCYRVCRFAEVSVSALEFYRPETKLLDRHNVAIVMLLRPVAPRGPSTEALGPLLCVVNTHLLFNPRRGDVKLAQLAILLAEIDRAVQSQKARGMSCNLIMCGDFNSVPHMPLYQLITTGQLNYQGLPAWKISGQEDLSYRTSYRRLFAPLWPCSLGVSDSCQYSTVAEDLRNRRSQKTGLSPPWIIINGKFFSHILRHGLDLESVYSHVLPTSGLPEVTILHSGGGATVDYIFYNPRRNLVADQGGAGGVLGEGLKLTGCLSLLSEDVLLSMNGLPNLIMPSDHLSLLAEFQMDL